MFIRIIVEFSEYQKPNKSLLLEKIFNPNMEYLGRVKKKRGPLY
jgi:hypothetical protein